MRVLVDFLRECRDLRRKFRQFRYRRKHRPALNLDKLERTMLNHLYAQKAKELGLASHALGPTVVIEGKGRRFHTHGVWTDFDTLPVALICGDKVLVRNVLHCANLRIPDGAAFPSNAEDAAFAYARTLEPSCVVKPARGTSSGLGVAVGIETQKAFRDAFRLAALFCDEVLVERFAAGDNYRFLVYKGKTISVLLRDLPSVIGDGRRTVADLILEENAKRIRSDDWKEGDPVLMPLPNDKTTPFVLAKQGLRLGSVPEAGRVVRVRYACSYALGASYVEVLDETHPTLTEAAERTARVLGVTLAGVDIIAPDIRAGEYVINEVNTTPGLECHYLVRNKERQKDPIRIILSEVFQTDQG